MEIKSFRDLRVWQSAMDVVEEIYRETQDFPRAESFGLTSQMRRAAVSIASNIAEGHARESTKEYLYQLSCAIGSLAELQTQVEICARLKYLHDAQPLLGRLEALMRQMHALRNALRARLPQK